MGSCCYTPTKRDFLWWYWLLLLSIVGIPLLAAVLYVARAKGDDGETKKARGKGAALIFWVGTAMVSFLVLTCLRFYLGGSRLSDSFAEGFTVLAIQFFLAFVAANAANNAVRKQRWYFRIPILVACIGVYFFLLIGSNLCFGYPAVNGMQFLVCMLPAHCWGQFRDRPETREAWRALLAFVVAAPLFFLVSYHGEEFVRLARGWYHSLGILPKP